MAELPADQELSIDGEQDIVAARHLARMFARALGFGAVDQSRIATAMSELTRNVVRYANDGRGQARIRAVTHANKAETIGLEIVVSDDGPGIENLDVALRDGFTSGAGLGMGLPGTRRLMDEMTIDSGPGRGTVVTIRKWRR